jgi:hypothetical protein
MIAFFVKFFKKPGLVFNKYFYKNKKPKLYFGDRVAILHDFIYQTGGTMLLSFDKLAIVRINLLG